MSRRLFQVIRARLIAFGCATAMTACGLAVSPQEAPQQRRIVVFWDFSRSISDTERQRWRDNLAQLSMGLGERLWLETEFDEVIVLPVHARTRTATPLLRQRFTGGELRENARRRERQQFAEAIAALDTIEVARGVLGGTDLLGSIARVNEYIGRDSTSIREIIYFSDMMHSMPGLDFEAARAPFTGTTATAAAERLATAEGWNSRALADVGVQVLLPGTIDGATSGINNDAPRMNAVRDFWYAAFAGVGAHVESWQR